MSILAVLKLGMNQATVNGREMDLTKTEDNFFTEVWGARRGDQAERRRELTHLDNVAGKGFSYNLEDFDQTKAFLADVMDGSLDGQANAADGSVVVGKGTVTVGHGAATYDLRNPADYNRMRADAADGRLDGSVPARTRGNTKEGCNQGDPSAQAGGNSPAQAGGNSPAQAGGNSPAQAGGNPPAGDTNAQAKEDRKRGIAEVNKYSPQELMKMVREGNIPDAIADSPEAMNFMLARIQEFSRMMQMISNMMQAQHDMLMAIVRNIKA